MVINCCPRFGLFKVEEQRQEGVGVLAASEEMPTHKNHALYSSGCLNTHLNINVAHGRIELKVYPEDTEPLELETQMYESQNITLKILTV